MNWYPAKRAGFLWGLGLLVALSLADGFLVRGALGAPVNLLLFWRGLAVLATLPLLALVGYVCYGLANLTYRVERNGIVIRWAASHDVVPMGDIREIVPFPAGDGRLAAGIGWPGYRIGQAQVKGVGPVRLYATCEPERALLIRTREQAYLISPANVEGFLADYRARRLLGPLARWKAGRRLPALLDLSIWRDRLAAGLVGPGLLLNVGLYGYLAARYPSLPPRLILSFDPRGLGDRIGARSELFLLPAIGLGILLLNGILAACVHKRERVLALLLLCSIPLVQTLVWIAASRLVS